MDTKPVASLQNEPGHEGNWVCAKCGLLVSKTSAVCPQDGTRQDDVPLIDSDQVLAKHYEFIATVGVGGMSVIYKARQLLLNKLVAIKMLHSHIVSDQAIMRFQQEAKAVTSLRHPNVIAVHDFGISEHGQPYMVMDFIDGPTLEQLIRERGSLTLPDALDIFLQVCDALSHAHNNNVLHRDLKPGNIMLIPKEGGFEVRLVDFGIAKIMDTGSTIAHQLTRTGELFGSPLYMSPEQCMGKSVDQRTDIYSLGCILYESLVGRPPHRGETLIDTIFKHLNDMPVPLKEARPDIVFPQAVEEFVMKLLSKRPEDRHQNMTEVKQRLVEIQSGALRGGGLLHKTFKFHLNMSYSKTFLLAGMVLAIVGFVALVQADRTLRQAQQMERESNAEVMLASASVSSDRLSEFYRDKLYVTQHQDMNDENVKEWLSHIDSLYNLDLSRSKVSNSIIDAIAKLRGLAVLNLSDTAISNDGLAKLSRMRSIRVLNLDRTMGTPGGILVLKDMKDLEELSLQGTMTDDEDLAALAALDKLKKLDLRDTQVSDAGLIHLVGMKSVKELYLSGTKISDAGVLILKEGKFGALRLSDTKVTGKSLQYLKDMKSLYHLTLNHVPLEPGQLEAIAHLEQLNYLELRHTNLSDRDIAHLSKLKTLTSLYLQDTLITDDSAREFEKMTQLKTLGLDGTGISDKFMVRICQKLKNLEAIMLNYTAISNSGAAAMSTLPALWRLEASHTRIADAGLMSLSQSHSLSYLVLYSPFSTRRGLFEFKKRLPQCNVDTWIDW